MSNGAIAASQTTGTNGVFGGSGLGNQQPPSPQGTPSGNGMGLDKIKAPNEVVVPPLITNNVAPGDSKADSIVSSQVPGMAGIAALGATIAVAACIGIPILVEATGARVKAKFDLHSENVMEHKFRQVHRDAKDSTWEWLDDKEKSDAKHYASKAMLADMRTTFEELHSSNPTVRAHAEVRARVIGIPIHNNGNARNPDWQLKTLGDPRNGQFHASTPDTHAPLYSLASHLHAQVEVLKTYGKADSDHVRLVQEQLNMLLNVLSGDHAANQTNYDHYANERAEKFVAKMDHIHQGIQKDFAREFPSLKYQFAGVVK